MLKTLLLPASALWWREMARFYRQPSRVVGALGSPLIFWFLIGSGVGRSFKSGGTTDWNYLQYFFPGTLMLILLFTAIFSTISLIEDRREGLLQSVLVAPVSRAAMVLGKILGGTTLAFSQAVIFLILAPFCGISLSLGSFAATSAILWVAGFGLTGLGFLLAWRMRSVQGFHAMMNIFLIPLWLLSGALFPPDGAHGWMRVAMQINPLTYGTASLRMTLFGEEATFTGYPGFWVCFGITAVFGLVMWIISARAASGQPAGD